MHCNCSEYGYIKSSMGMALSMDILKKCPLLNNFPTPPAPPLCLFILTGVPVERPRKPSACVSINEMSHSASGLVKYHTRL